MGADGLVDLFCELVAVDSESMHEGEIAALVESRLCQWGCRVRRDGAGRRIGSDAGNLYVRAGTSTGSHPLLLSAHLDTVKPGRGIVPRVGKRVIRSDGKPGGYRWGAERKQQLLRLEAKGKREVTAADIQPDPEVEILNPDLKIATLNKDGKLKMEMVVARGRGYVPVERSAREREVVGTIPLDAMFSPVTRVSYKVTNCRVGQRTDYDKLILDVHTDGSIKADEAVTMAAKVLIEHIALFSSLSGDLEVKPFAEAETGPGGPMRDMSIDELELPVRALNCLHREGIRTVGELVDRTEDDLLAMRNFGSRSIEEVKERLAAIGLELKKSQQAG